MARKYPAEFFSDFTTGQYSCGLQRLQGSQNFDGYVSL